MTEIIEKRKVTMTSAVAQADGSIATHVVVDYVPTDLLEVYVADAHTRWQAVEVGEEHDPGPGGDEGATFYPEHLDHPLAGQTLNALPPHERHVTEELPAETTED